MGHFGTLIFYIRCLGIRWMLIRALCVAACLQVSLGVAHAQPDTKFSEGDEVEHYLSITQKTWNSKSPLLELPLPPGKWTLRHIQEVRNNIGRVGRVFWLDQVQDGEVVGLIFSSVWENGGINWVPGETRCTGTLLVRAREPGLNGGCFSLSVKSFMSNSKNAAQMHIRKMWDRAGLKSSNRALMLDGFFEKRSGAVLYFEYALPTRALGIPDSMSLVTSPERTQALAMAVKTFQEGAVDQWFRGYGESVNEQVMLSPSDRRAAATDRLPILSMLKTAITAHLNEEDRRLVANMPALPEANKITSRAPAETAPSATSQVPSQEELERMREELAALREQITQNRLQQDADSAKKAEKPPERPITANITSDAIPVNVKTPGVVAPQVPSLSKPKPLAPDVREVISSRQAVLPPVKGPFPEVREPVFVKPAASSSRRTPIPEIREVQPRPAPLVRKKPEQDFQEIKPVPQLVPRIPP